MLRSVAGALLDIIEDDTPVAPMRPTSLLSVRQ